MSDRELPFIVPEESTLDVPTEEPVASIELASSLLEIEGMELTVDSLAVVRPAASASALSWAESY